jgi:rare lipoprotein A
MGPGKDQDRCESYPTGGVPMKRVLTVLVLALAMSLAVAVPAQADVASWYDLPGNYTASGDIYESYDRTCASNTYDFGTYLTVTNLYNGWSTTCVVTDTGAFDYYGRDVDLSYQSAVDIGIIYVGVANVDIQYAGRDWWWYYYKQY